jgi:hypothetical protein
MHVSWSRTVAACAATVACAFPSLVFAAPGGVRIHERDAVWQQMAVAVYCKTMSTVTLRTPNVVSSSPTTCSFTRRWRPRS